MELNGDLYHVVAEESHKYNNSEVLGTLATAIAITIAMAPEGMRYGLLLEVTLGMKRIMEDPKIIDGCGRH